MSKAGTQDRTQAASPSPLHLARRTARYWKTAALVLVGGLVVTGVLAAGAKQVYRSESVILYRQAARQGYGDGENAKRVGTRLRDMVMSHERLKKVADEMKLFPDAASPQQAIDEMKKKVFFHVQDGSTFQIAFQGDSPELVQKVTSTLTNSLISDNARVRTQEAEETRKLLQAERDRFENDVRQKEAALSAFLSGNPEVLQTRTPNPAASSSAGDLASVEAEIARLRAGKGESRPSAPAGPDPALVAEQRRAEAALATAQKDLDDKLQRYTDAHPDVIAAKERVAQAKLSALKANATAVGVAQPAGQQPTTAGGAGGETDRQIAVLERRLRGIRSTPATTVLRVSPKAAQLEVQLQSLKYDLQEARERLATIEDKQSQAALIAKMESSGEIGQLTVLNPAYVPGLPLVDVRKKVAMAGVALSLMLALGLAFLRAMTDDRIYDRGDAEWMTSHPVLVAVPSQRGRRITARV